jgi:hypothetical protein
VNEAQHDAGLENGTRIIGESDATVRRKEHQRMPTIRRCSWAEIDPLLRAHHDEEWGVLEYDSRALWEKLMLDGFQAGLSWTIILRKRDAFAKLLRTSIRKRLHASTRRTSRVSF